MTRRNICIALALLAALMPGAVACKKQPQYATPAASFTAFFEASKTGDVATIKRTMSKRGLELSQSLADEQKVTLDQYLKKYPVDPAATLPEMRNEKINGDSATLEIKGKKTGNWETWNFVKEDGGWKIAFEKDVEEVPAK
jgi:hypothetical protein